MAATTTATYRVVSLNEAGPDRVVVNFQQEVESPIDGTAIFGGNVSLSLTNTEAQAYFPGQKYTLAFTLVT